MNQEIDSILTQIKETQDFFQKAKLLLFLKRDKELRVSELARKLQIKPAYISHILRLNRLPDLVKDGYYSKLISLSHLFIISRLKSTKQMTEVYEKVLAEDLTTLQTESIVRESLYNINDQGTHVSKNEIEEFAGKYSSSGDIETKIIQSRLRAKFAIEIKGNLERTSQELRKIMKLLSRGS